MADRPYKFLELTNSLCTQCLNKIEAKLIEQDRRIYMDKLCLEHGRERVLIATDAEYWHRARRTIKPGQMVKRFNTSIERGCPWDCGICPDHEQHGCLTLVELTDRCNLTCPVCYADSGPARGAHRSLEQITAMLDAVVANEGEPDVVQLSGGEPTMHPEFWPVLDAAMSRPIKHVMLNTNGTRLANERAFVEKLAGYERFEVYLQFDSFEEHALQALRGADLRETRMKALAHLNEFNVSTTLVVTLQKGLNDHEIGRIIEFAAQQPAVRGVTFQPVQNAGRLDQFDPASDRLTLTEVRSSILQQSDLFTPEDVVPVPCHPDCIAMAYALKLPGGGAVPVSTFFDPQQLLEQTGNTVLNEQTPELRKRILDLFSTSHSPVSSTLSLKSLLCCLPKLELPVELGYENVFRVIIMQFLDPWNFDVRSVKRSCVHIAHPDGRVIPFDTYNLFYRPGVERMPAGAAK
ncbi:MAG: radical SAM protein [Planctomycetes bacterium]|nr:radical SAM protein [Planctomycetota bacterium]